MCYAQGFLLKHHANLIPPCLVEQVGQYDCSLDPGDAILSFLGMPILPRFQIETRCQTGWTQDMAVVIPARHGSCCASQHCIHQEWSAEVSSMRIHIFDKEIHVEKVEERVDVFEEACEQLLNQGGIVGHCCPMSDERLRIVGSSENPPGVHVLKSAWADRKSVETGTLVFEDTGASVSTTIHAARE